MDASKDILFKEGIWYARHLDSSDGDALQALLERCADYFQLVCGTPPGPSEAQTLFADLPEGMGYEDKVVIGIFLESDSLIGVLDAVRDYPAPGEWFLGLLLLEPRWRNVGLGAEAYRAFERRAAGFGAKHIRLGVVEQNAKAYHFWQGMGFQTVEKRPPQRIGGLERSTIVMRRSTTH